jgi:hypothetical protein
MSANNLTCGSFASIMKTPDDLDRQPRLMSGDVIALKSSASLQTWNICCVNAFELRDRVAGYV